MFKPVTLLLLALFTTAASAQTTPTPEAPAQPAAEPVAPINASALDPKLPVTAADIADRPYTVLGEVKAGVRKATVFSKAPSHDKIYRELWERGQKLGADAVILATYGKPHINAISWGSVTASGKAIRFTK